MSLPLYKKALAKSWHFTWKHPFLWFFGLFAAALGQMGIFEVFNKLSTLTDQKLAFYGHIPSMLRGSREIGVQTIPMEAWILFVWLLILIGGVMLVLVFVSVSSQGALIDAAALGVGKDKSTHAQKVWKKGIHHFWPLLTLNLVKRIVILALVAFMGWLVIAFGGISAWWFTLLSLLAIIIGMILSLLVIYAGGYIVVEEYPLKKAIPAAWKLFTNHWLVSIEVGCILVIINILVLFVLLIGLLFFFIEGVLLFLIFAFFGSAAVLMGIAIGLLILFVAFVLFVQAVFTVYVTSVWTYLFMHMHKRGLKSHILHLLGRR